MQQVIKKDVDITAFASQDLWYFALGFAVILGDKKLASQRALGLDAGKKILSAVTFSVATFRWPGSPRIFRIFAF